MPFSATPLHILVIEDNTGDFILFEEYLKLTQLNIVELHQGTSLADASALKDVFTPDIAFLDLSLPDSKGVESFVQFNKVYSDVPIVVLSGLTDAKVAIECISLGAQDYLIKDELNDGLLKKSIHYSIERKKTLEQILKNQVDYQKQLTEATIEAQEKQKEEIGKELHDNINQILASAKLYLELAATKENTKDEMIDHSKRSVIYAIDEIRKLSHSLVPPTLGDHGLIDAVEELVEELNHLSKFSIKLHVNDYDESILDSGKKLMLYRIIQEQINNIIKYSKASEVNLSFTSNEGGTVLKIQDNGIGFDTSLVKKGIGLRNMESRISFYSGKIKITSAPGKGTSILICLP